MNNRRYNNSRNHEKKCIFKKCHCLKWHKKKCILRLPVCIECPGSFELENIQDNIEII